MSSLFFLAQELTKEFTCPICLCYFEDPVWTFPCKHIFCKECIKRALEVNHNCPCCKVALDGRNNFFERVPSYFDEILFNFLKFANNEVFAREEKRFTVAKGITNEIHEKHVNVREPREESAKDYLSPLPAVSSESSQETSVKEAEGVASVATSSHQNLQECVENFFDASQCDLCLWRDSESYYCEPDANIRDIKNLILRCQSCERSCHALCYGLLYDEKNLSFLSLVKFLSPYLPSSSNEAKNLSPLSAMACRLKESWETWTCNACLYLSQETGNNKINCEQFACVLCGQKKNLMLKLLHQENFNQKKKISVHGFCANWIPELSNFDEKLFYENNTLPSSLCDQSQAIMRQENWDNLNHNSQSLSTLLSYFQACLHQIFFVYNYDSIPKSRWTLRCSYCEKKIGAPIQCALSVCCTAFHPLCALKKGCLPFRTQRATDRIWSVKMYCEKHSVKKIFDEKLESRNGIEILDAVSWETYRSYHREHKAVSMSLSKHQKVQQNPMHQKTLQQSFLPEYESLSQNASKNIILCTSGLTFHQMTLMNTFAQKFGCEHLANIDASTSLLVVNSNHSPLYCRSNGVLMLCSVPARRTIKLLLAQVYGIPSVGFDWVEKCLTHNQILDEKNFLVSKDSTGGANIRDLTRIVRLGQKERLPLFGIKFYLVELDCPTLPSSANIRTIIERAGGEILVPPNNCVSETETDRARTIRNYRPNEVLILTTKPESISHEYATVSFRWICDSLSLMKLQPVNS